MSNVRYDEDSRTAYLCVLSPIFGYFYQFLSFFRHLILPFMPNVPYDEDSRTANLCVLLHGALKTSSLCALVQGDYIYMYNIGLL